MVILQRPPMQLHLLKGMQAGRPRLLAPALEPQQAQRLLLHKQQVLPLLRLLVPALCPCLRRRHSRRQIHRACQPYCNRWHSTRSTLRQSSCCWRSCCRPSWAAGRSRRSRRCRALDALHPKACRCCWSCSGVCTRQLRAADRSSAAAGCNGCCCVRQRARNGGRASDTWGTCLHSPHCLCFPFRSTCVASPASPQLLCRSACHATPCCLQAGGHQFGGAGGSP